MDLAPEPDQRRGQGVDLDVEGQDDGAVRLRVDEGRGTSGRPEARRAPFRDEAARDQLTDQAADRTPGQAGPGN